MKTVYFVRHGESTANVGDPVFQGLKSELSDKGVEQAQFIAERCKKLDFDALISSHAVRARKTAEYISQATGKKFEIEEMFVERRQPTSLVGLSKNDRTLQLQNQWIQSLFEPNLRVEDGENFTDLKTHALSALAYLKDRPESHILVVTHGFFLHMVVALVILGDTITPREFSKAASAVWMDNTGITRIEYRDEIFSHIGGVHYKGWILRVWNDHAHLG